MKDDEKETNNEITIMIKKGIKKTHLKKSRIYIPKKNGNAE